MIRRYSESNTYRKASLFELLQLFAHVRKVFAQFRREAAKHQPKLAVETGLMALDGNLEMPTS